MKKFCNKKNSDQRKIHYFKSLLLASHDKITFYSGLQYNLHSILKFRWEDFTYSILNSIFNNFVIWCEEKTLKIMNFSLVGNPEIIIKSGSKHMSYGMTHFSYFSFNSFLWISHLCVEGCAIIDVSQTTPCAWYFSALNQPNWFA